MMNFNDDFISGHMFSNATCIAKENGHGVFSICYRDSRERPAYTLNNVTLDPAIEDTDLNLEVKKN